MTDEVVDEDPIRCYQSDREELPLSDNDDIENESPRKHTPSVNLKHDSDHSIKELISKRKRAQGKLQEHFDFEVSSTTLRSSYLTYNLYSVHIG